MAPAQILRDHPTVEAPPEIPDGVVTDFTVDHPYVSGTTSVWLNGVRLQDDLETGFIELAPNTVRFQEAPVSGDVIEIQYQKA